jgi:hypothetical protein
MKVLILILSVLSGPQAFATVLGELSGTGNLISTTVIEENNQTSSYKADCNFAMNIKDTPETFEYQWASIQCGGIVFNEALPALKKDGKNLMLDKKGRLLKVGEIQSDGTLAIWLSKDPETRKLNEYIPDSINCAYDRGTVREVTFYLYANWDYNFRKNQDGSWSFHFDRRENDVASYFKKIGMCTYTGYSRTSNVMTIEGQVK